MLIAHFAEKYLNVAGSILVFISWIVTVLQYNGGHHAIDLI